jgi:hypothetical protein
MNMIKRDVRFKAESFESIREISKDENKSIQDTIRDLCDIGISYKKAKKTNPENRLSPFESEALKTLHAILSLNNLSAMNTLDFDKKSISSQNEFINEVKNNAKDSFCKFKEKNDLK